MKAPKRPPRRPDPETMQFHAVMAGTFTLISIICLVGGAGFPVIFEVAITVFVLLAWREVRRYDRWARTAEAPEMERITRP